MNKTAKEIFKETVKGSNFMTPNIIKYLKLGKDGAIEISTGKGITGNDMFGVTVVEDGEHKHNLTKSLALLDSALMYAKGLQRDKRLQK